MLPDDEICFILVVAHAEREPDERVLALARGEADRSGVQLGEWLGLRPLFRRGPLFHVFLGVRDG